MIDLTLLRENNSRIAALISTKDPSFPIQELTALDTKNRALATELEKLRARKNELAQEGKKGVTPELKQESQTVSAKIKDLEQEFINVEEKFKQLYLRCPNVPMDNIPLGGKEANTPVKVFKDKPVFDFEPKNHVELGNALGWFDFEAAARMTGSNFALYKNEGVKVVYALMMFMLKNNIKHGYSPVLPPYLVTEKSLECASNFPRFKDEVYALPADQLYLTPTAEVNLTNIYRDHIFALQDLPVRMTAWTSCFRREAGSYGSTERGLIRIHQFEKAELYTICDPQDSQKELDRMIACAEDILQKLDLHYRVSLLATQDMSFASAKTFDIEVWMPGQKAYYEVSSSSNCTDFQARRSAMRFKETAQSKTKFVHTLNASSLALPRLMVALMETYQNSDGTITIPDVLKSEGLW